MRKYALLVAISVGYGTFAYVLLNNVIMSALMGLVCGFLMFKFILPSIDKASTYLDRLNELHAFASSVTMQLATTPSTYDALKQCEMYFSKGVKEIYHNYGDDLTDFLESLTDFFRNKSYDILSQLLKIYEANGGDIKKPLDAILSDITFKKESANNLMRIKKRKITEFFTMWVFAFVSLVYLRVGLASYYIEMLDGALSIAVIASLLLFLFSVTKAFVDLKSISFEGEL